MNNAQARSEVLRQLVQIQFTAREIRSQIDDPQADPLALMHQLVEDAQAALTVLHHIRLCEQDRLILAAVPALARQAGMSPMEYVRHAMLDAGQNPALMRPAFVQALTELGHEVGLTHPSSTGELRHAEVTVGATGEASIELAGDVA